MFEPNSHYYNLETVDPIWMDGCAVAYRRRRFVPQANAAPILQEIIILESDRTCRDPLSPSEQSCQTCDYQGLPTIVKAAQ
jgi:hypothetical protein